jgi:hypothetical protein
MFYFIHFNCGFWRKFENFCTISAIIVFLKSSFEYKKKNYPVHKPDAVDFILFNFGELLTISNFVWRALITESSHVVKKVGLPSHKEINILV